MPKRKVLGAGGEKAKAKVEDANSTSIESIVPGIKTEGLRKEKSGFYINDDLSKRDTLAIDSSYSAILRSITFTGESAHSKKCIDETARFLKDKVVVDLGAGTVWDGYRIAAICGAKAYIGVEPYGHERLASALKAWTSDKRKTKEPKIPYVVVSEDMRDFVKRLPPDSVCFFTFGIDGAIAGRMEAFDELLEQITRALHPHGAQMSFDSITRGNGLNHFITTEERIGRQDPYELLVKEAVSGGEVNHVIYKDRPAYSKITSS